MDYRKEAIMILPILIGVFWGCAYGQRRPPNYGQGHMPETTFSCTDKIIGGYYADPETDCQMFHVCVKIPGKGIQDFRFLCPNDTSFDQENQICDDWYNIDCEAATLFYSDNFDLYRVGGAFGKIGGKVSQVNNAVGEVGDDNYLQRADRGENIPQDIFRGSQSGNFFSNRNGGREDYDDDDYSKPSKKQAHDKAAKHHVKKPQEPAKEVTYHQNKDQIRYQNRNSNFRRNNFATSTAAVTEQQTSTTVRPSRGQSFRQDFSRQRNQGSTTVRPVAQDNSYNPTTTTAKPIYNNYQITTLRPFNNFNNQQTTQRQNQQTYQQNTAATTVRPNYSNYQQTTAKTYQDITRTFPANQQTSAQTQKPYNAFVNNQQQSFPTPKPINNFGNNQQQASVPTQKPYNTYNNQQQTPAQTVKPYNAFNNQQQTPAQTVKPYNAFNNQQQVSPTAKPYNSFGQNQQQPTTATAKPYNAYTNNQQGSPSTPKPYNAYQQASVTPSYTTAAQQQSFAPVQQQNYNAQQNYNNHNQNAFNPSQQNYQNAYTQRPHTNGNSAAPHQNQNAPLQTQAPFNAYTQKSYSQSFSESTEVTRVNPNQYQNFQSRNNYNFASTPSPNYSTNNNFNQNFDAFKVTTAKPYDAQNARAPNQYHDEQDEFLKTAHSQNLGSSLRTKALNASQAAAYNFIPSGTTGKPKKIESKTTAGKNNFQNFNGISTAQTFSPQKSQYNGFTQNNAVRSTSAPNFRSTVQQQSPSTFPPQPSQKKPYNATPDRSKQQYQKPYQQSNQSQTTAQPQQTSPQPFSAAQPNQQQDNQDYDYAYYDSAGPNEYEGIGNVEFKRTTPHRSTA